MMFRNSYRMLLANFSTFWKDFLYKTVVLSILVLLTLPTLSAITKLNDFEAFALQAENLFSSFAFSNIKTLILSVFDFLNLLIKLLASLFSNSVWHSVNFVGVYFFVLPFFLSLSSLGINEVLYGNMATNTKYNYGASFIKTLKKAILLSFLKTFINLFVFSLSFAAIYGLLFLGANEMLSTLLLPMLITLSICLISGFKTTLLSGWAPSIIVFNTTVFNGFLKGIKAVSRRFFKTFSTAAMMVLINVIFASFLGISSLPLLLPLANMLAIIFGMVMFFGSQGMRYYVDPDTILSPKKLEETDRFEDAINII